MDIAQELHSSPKFADTRVGVASRCDHPDWGRECLRKFMVQAMLAATSQGFACFDLLSSVDGCFGHRASRAGLGNGEEEGEKGWKGSGESGGGGCFGHLRGEPDKHTVLRVQDGVSMWDVAEGGELVEIMFSSSLPLEYRNTRSVLTAAC